MTKTNIQHSCWCFLWKILKWFRVATLLRRSKVRRNLREKERKITLAKLFCYVIVLLNETILSIGIIIHYIYIKVSLCKLNKIPWILNSLILFPYLNKTGAENVKYYAFIYYINSISWSNGVRKTPWISWISNRSVCHVQFLPSLIFSFINF